MGSPPAHSRLTGEGEVFFLQERIGKHGKTFKLFKFATMLKNSPSLGTGTVTVKNDPRILPVGQFLRKTKINELPQLVNIFIGDMSVIGPRPLTKQTFSAYSSDTRKTIETVRPGLSGIGSIIFRGEEDILAGAKGSLDFYNNVIAPYKGELEKWYTANQSLINYFKAIITTVIVVLSPNSTLAWKWFNGLPTPPNELKDFLNYPKRAS
ncbi:sugar transferase [Chromobacterium piscinae]|uniref:sugar transferase n=1 Tax=Chromobacterium piscinae TaxID=686831 RepID=UPI0031FCD61D